jgi:hypothetical protein
LALRYLRDLPRPWDPASCQTAQLLVVLLEALQSIPEPDASAEQDGDQHDVHVVDEPGSKELDLIRQWLDVMACEPSA